MNTFIVPIQHGANLEMWGTKRLLIIMWIKFLTGPQVLE